MDHCLADIENIDVILGKHASDAAGHPGPVLASDIDEKNFLHSLSDLRLDLGRHYR